MRIIKGKKNKFDDQITKMVELLFEKGSGK